MGYNNFLAFSLILVVGVFAISPTALAATTQVVMSPGAGSDQSCVAANNCFSPNQVNIAVGDSVTWTNNDNIGHTTTYYDGNMSDNSLASIWNSGLVLPGGTYTFTFQNAGTYPYFCEVHPWMIGSISVVQSTQQYSPTPPYSQPIQDSISVSTDKTSYSYGDAILISGSVTPVISGQTLSIQIAYPNGYPGGTYSVTPSSDGTYSYLLQTNGSVAPAGTMTVYATYGNARNYVSFSYSGVPPSQPAQPSTNPQPTLGTQQGAVHYRMIFVDSWGQCTDFQKQALDFYQSVTDQYLQKYGLTPLPETWCVYKNDLTSAIAASGSYDIMIVIPDIIASVPYVLNGEWGHYAVSGNTRSIVSQADSLTPESPFSAWTLSHELSHFILQYKGYSRHVWYDWVHQTEMLKRQCETKDPSLLLCTTLWTTVQSPGGTSIPVMIPYTNPQAQPLLAPTQPTLSIQQPTINGLTVTINGNAEAMSVGALPYEVVLDWGDGQKQTVSLFPAGSMFQQTHTYSQSGAYKIQIGVLDDFLNSNSITQSVTVGNYVQSSPTPSTPQSNCPSGYYLANNGLCYLNQQQVSCPKGYFLASNNLCYLYIYPTLNVQNPAVNGLTVTVYGSTQANTYGASINEILWNWGDGQSLYGGFPQGHTYANAGTYTIKVLSCDNYQYCRWQSYTITVQSTPPPQYASPSQPSPQSTPTPTPAPYTLSVQTDQTSYTAGNPVFFQINGAGVGQNVSIIVTDPSSNVIQKSSVSIDTTGHGTGVINLAPDAQIGPYQITAAESSNGNFLQGSTKFTVSSQIYTPQPQPENTSTSPSTFPVDGTQYSVTYTITNGKVLDIKVDQPHSSLIVSTQTTGDGILTITLTRGLIDSKNSDGTDKPYVVANDGQIVQFIETSTTVTDRTLVIPFKSGTQQIAMMGTWVLGFSNQPTTVQQTQSQSTQFTVLVNQNGFNPQTIKIPVGSTVTWKIQDNGIYGIQSNIFSGNIGGQRPSTYSYYFSAEGIYSYQDAIHPSNTGQIIVVQITPPPPTPQSFITISTDKKSYSSGDTIVISGSIQNPPSSSNGYVAPNIIITNPSGDIFALDGSSSGDATYSAKVLTNGNFWKNSGTYSIKANTSDYTNSTTIQFNAQTHTQTCFLFWCW